MTHHVRTTERAVCCYCKRPIAGRPHPLFRGVNGIMRPCARRECQARYASETAWMNPSRR